LVRSVLSRLGIVGVTLRASALIFGALAGAIVVHRLATTQAASQQPQTNAAGDQIDNQTTPPKSKRPIQSPSTSGEVDDS
jgi:uncharacterized membrane protein